MHGSRRLINVKQKEIKDLPPAGCWNRENFYFFQEKIRRKIAVMEQGKEIPRAGEAPVRGRGLSP